MGPCILFTRSLLLSIYIWAFPH